MPEDLGNASTLPQSVMAEEVKQEREWLTVALDLAFALVNHRADNLMMSWYCFPCRHAQFFGDPGAQQKCLAWSKKIATAYQACVKRQEAHIKDKVARSFMNTAAAHHVFNHLSFATYERVPDEVMRCTQASFAIGQSRVQEKSFHGRRQSETTCQTKKRGSAHCVDGSTLCG